MSTPAASFEPSSGKVDVVVAGAGTGGTVTGISRAIKKTHNQDCVIVGVDPVRGVFLKMKSEVPNSFLLSLQKGSILAVPDSLNEADRGAQYIVEGIGYDFIPDVLCQGDVDEWIKTSDEESFQAVQVLMKNEGLLVGGSSGSSLAGAIQWFTESEKGKRMAATEGKNVVVLLPDGFVSVTSFVFVLT